MTTPHGWEPRTGPTRGDPARRPPRGPGGWARDAADPRRQGPRGGAAGDDWNAGPSFTPARGPGGPRDNGSGGPRDNGSGGPRDNGSGGPRGGRQRPPRNPGGNAPRGGPADDFIEAGLRPGGPGRPVNRDRPSGGSRGPVNGPGAFQPSGLARWLGRLPAWTAMLMLIGGALLGVVFTLIAGQEPGALLGFFVIVGSIAAVLCIQRGKVYLLFPVPALVFFVAAILVGKVHDANLGSSTAGLGAGFTQWVAGIFFPAVVATILVLLIGGGRWLLGRQLVTGQSLLAPGGPARPSPPRGSPRPAPPARPRRPAPGNPDRDPWGDDNSSGDQRASKNQTMPTGKSDRPAWMGRPGGGTARQTPHPPRDRGQRTDRDPWGDPRLPPDHGQPPGTGTRPRPDAQPQPRGRGQRPSFNPNPTPQRPPRRPPPGGWNQR